jgi:hypothetical protein
MRFDLQRVRYIPAELRPGVLYVSKEFSIAVHLCACGCGTKIRTPLGPTEWSVKKTAKGPTLDPSVGNWQEPCQSHSGYTAARSHGLVGGRRSKLPQDAGTRTSVEWPIWKPEAESGKARSEGSPVG